MSNPDSPPQNNTAPQTSSPPPPPLVSPPPPAENGSSPPSSVTPASLNSSPPPQVSTPPPLLSPPPPSSPPPVPESGPPKVSSPPPSPSNSKASSPPPPKSSSGASSPPPPPPTVPANQSPPASGGQQSQPAPYIPPPSNNNPTPNSGNPKLSPPPPFSNPQQTNVPSPVIPATSLPLAKSPPLPKLPPPSVFGRAPPPPSTTHTTLLSPPSKSAKSPPAESRSKGNTGTAIAVGMAGVFVIGLIALIFVASKRKKRRREIVYTPHYVAPTPSNFSTRSDGNYYVQQQNISNSGLAEGFYSQAPPSSYMNTYGSQRVNTYNGGGAESGISTAKTFFTYEELMDITNGFSRQNILGEGGFGCVYKGWLADGKLVAVKTLKVGSGQGEREFRAEVEIISRVHHRHLVSLVGYCISEQKRLLIYEFVPNKTLEHHLHGEGLPVLEWSKRLKIALGSAKGLAYLHEDCHPKIIHRDIKSANILLDDVFEAQVADFGLAKLTNDTSTHVSTRVMGTFGYMAPEYASSGKLTDRSDVFSFGVVLLELITGRKSVDTTQPLGDESLVEWARPLLIDALETLEFRDLVDPRLERCYVESEMLRMIEAAAACIRHSAPKRPRMAQVVRALDTESEMSDLSNGVKFGQSTIYDSAQYNQDINRFRKMALGLSRDSSEYEIQSGEYNSREFSSNYRDGGSSSESETRAFNTRSSDQRYSSPQIHYGNPRF